MPSFLGACLQGIAADLPPSLVPAPGELERFVASLPIAFADELGLECRLGERGRPVDVLLRLSSPPEDTSSPMLASLQTFLQTWRDAPLSLRDIWLEFDRDPSPKSPAPNLFFGPRGGLEPASASARRPAILAALRALVDDTRAREAEAGLFALIAELPAGGQVFHLGVMLARPTRALRVCVMDLAPADLAGTLQRIGWPGPRALVGRALRVCAPWIDRITLALDVDGLPAPRLGIEFHTDRWPGLLAALVPEGLCSTTEAAELLAWPGHRADGEAFPEPLGRMARFLEGRRRSVLHRALSHLKLVIDPSLPLPLEAKAYLSIQHRFH